MRQVEQAARDLDRLARRLRTLVAGAVAGDRRAAAEA
jgi:hypothetical protein